jgi:hypothetical protein
MEFGSYSFGDENFDDVKNKLKSIRPEAVGTASTAYKEAADVLAEMTDELRNNFAKRIIKHWQGDVAQEALDQLGQVYETSGKLSNDSHNNAQLYNWYKVNILDWYKTTGETMEDGYIHTGGDDDRARELMQKFNTRMKEAFDGHPLKITKDLPTTYGGGHDKPPGGGIPPGGPGGGVPGGGGGGFGGGAPGGFGGGSGGANIPTSDGSGAFSPSGGSSPFAPGGTSPFNPSTPGGGGPHLPTGDGVGGSSPFDGGSGTDLSSFPGGGGPGLAGGPGLGGGGLGGGGLPGGGGGGFGADPGGFGGAGAGTGSAGGPGGAFGGGGPGAGAAGRGAGAGMRPMGGMPMGHGAQGGQDEERERNTWLTEDEDVWGADDDTAPPVIG